MLHVLERLPERQKGFLNHRGLLVVREHHILVFRHVSRLRLQKPMKDKQVQMRLEKR